MAQRIGSRQHDDIGRVEEVSVDVVDDANALPVKNSFYRRMEVRESDDNAMDGGDVRAFACSLERLMNEIDDNTAFKKISPQWRDGNALPDRICGDESASRFCVVNEVGGFFEPASHVVKIAITGNARENFCHVRFLRGVLKTLADKGRVADDVVDFGRDGSPVDSERVALVNIGVTFQRKKIQITMNNFLGLLNHLQFSNPKGGLSDGNGKVVNFDAKELSYRNFDRIEEFAKLNLRTGVHKEKKVI